MGLWGRLSTPFRGEPGPGTARPPVTDPYYSTAGKGGAGTTMARGADAASYQLLMKYLGREPGYSDAEQEAMYAPVAEQTKSEEQGALRRLNQGAVGAGSFGSGGTAAGRGAIIAGGMGARASARQNIKVAAAQAALQDRINQIQTASSWVLPRQGLVAGQVQGLNAYNSSLNTLDVAKWRSLLDQYNYNFDKTEEYGRQGLGAAMAMMNK